MKFSFFRKNLLLKILSILFAVLMWFIVTKEEKSILTMTVPLELKNLSNNFIISNNYASKIDLRIQGTKSILADIASGDIAVSLDVAKSRLGENRFFLRPENVKHPFGTEILLIEPSIIKLNVQKKIQKIVPVKLKIEGKPKEGYQIVETSLEPKTVPVIGPEDEVSKIEEAVTESVNVKDRDKSFTVELPLMITSSHISFSAVEKIKAEIRIREINISKKLDNIPVIIMPANYKIDYNPKTVEVILEGPQSAINALDSKKITAEVDISKLEPSPKDYRLTPELRLNSKPLKGFTIQKMTPPAVDVRIYSKQGAGKKN